MQMVPEGWECGVSLRQKRSRAKPPPFGRLPTPSRQDKDDSLFTLGIRCGVK